MIKAWVLQKHNYKYKFNLSHQHMYKTIDNLKFNKYHNNIDL